METIKARVVEHDNKHFIKIETENDKISIPISEDKPNEVKSAFNKLIALIKDMEFQIGLEEIGPDLFSQVANEYITQLNREILEVRDQMKGYGLVGD
jgi:hypothetical protein